MQFGYGWLRTWLVGHAKRLVVVLSLLALPVTMLPEKSPPSKPTTHTKPPEPIPPDPRTVRLTKFFSKLHCPVVNLADEFVHTADDYELDWRLLPSIAVIESGGGKAYKNNNIFGWDQGEALFSDIRAGLHEVAYKLARSPLYRNQDVMGKLRLYNPDENYAPAVVNVMNRISPVVNLRPARENVGHRNQMAYATD